MRPAEVCYLLLKVFLVRQKMGHFSSCWWEKCFCCYDLKFGISLGRDRHVAAGEDMRHVRPLGPVHRDGAGRRVHRRPQRVENLPRQSGS